MGAWSEWRAELSNRGAGTQRIFYETTFLATP